MSFKTLATLLVLRGLSFTLAQDSACAESCNDTLTSCQATTDADLTQCQSDYTTCLDACPVTTTTISTTSSEEPTTTRSTETTTSSTDTTTTSSTETTTSSTETTTSSLYTTTSSTDTTTTSSSYTTTTTPAITTTTTTSWTTTSTPSPTTTISVSPCAQACNDALDDCQAAPNANQASCAANYASCLNYDPFTNTPFVTATACSASSTTTTTPPATTTSVSPCAQACNAALVSCQNAPNANQASCAANYASCLNYNPYTNTPFVTATACSARSTTTTPPATTTSVSPCAQKCNAALVSCQNAPNANQASCAAQYASCLSYNPYTNTPFVTATACSPRSTTTTPPWTTTTAPPAPGCAQKCVSSYTSCNTASVSGLPPNHAYCAAQLAGCVNYNPFTGSPFVTPTACSPTLPPPAHTTTPAAGCAQKCVSSYNSCNTASVSGMPANHAYCAAQLAGCVNYNPFTGGSTFVTPTACSPTSPPPSPPPPTSRSTGPPIVVVTTAPPPPPPVVVITVTPPPVIVTTSPNGGAPVTITSTPTPVVSTITPTTSATPVSTFKGDAAAAPAALGWAALGLLAFL
ncbi:uncharacterized protein AB675_7109 [Cyphellophora attinorum]|uniref:Uncharacterized protein n=1 Tax=Cyphellophora attinorum TaxID=1664694 RepID=A0A0N1HEG8_9EURO|nr:uncharacterized protein AB675_7109 [Phialophora attinorum]KPI43382.1 hypothetical protein AB675_7109 [Phialophora attinorum]